MAGSKNLWIMGIHASGNGLMLQFTQSGQLPAVPLCILTYPLHDTFNLKSERSKIAVISKLLFYPEIAFIPRHPSRTMAPVMTDIIR